MLSNAQQYAQQSLVMLKNAIILKEFETTRNRVKAVSRAAADSVQQLKTPKKGCNTMA